jgi:hypothetical protein
MLYTQTCSLGAKRPDANALRNKRLKVFSASVWCSGTNQRRLISFRELYGRK